MLELPKYSGKYHTYLHPLCHHLRAQRPNVPSQTEHGFYERVSWELGVEGTVGGHGVDLRRMNPTHVPMAKSWTTTSMPG